MRRTVFLLTLLLLLGGLAAWQFQQGQGYILIAVGAYTIEMSLWVGLLLVVVFWFAWTLLRGLVARLFGPRQGLLPVWRHARQRRYRARRDEGVLEMLEGRWRNATKLLESSGRKSTQPLISWLAAGFAALEDGDHEQAQKFLANAAADEPDAFGVRLLEVRLLRSQQRDREALPILERLHAREPGHREVLRLLVDTHRKLGHWQSLEKLLPELKRRKLFKSDELGELTLNVYHALLVEAGGAEADELVASRDRILSVWERIPAAYRRQGILVAALVRQLNRAGEGQLAESQLRNTLKREWNPELVGLYGIIEHRDLSESLAVAEKWLPMHRDDPVLLLTLGRLCLRSELWGKSKDYFEAALRLHPSPAVYAELAALAAHLGDTAGSAEYYRRGLTAQSGVEGVMVSGTGQPRSLPRPS